MRILVVSDSHYAPDKVAEAYRRANGQSFFGKVEPISLILHCGDGGGQYHVHAVPILQVKGNCDYDPDLPDDLLTTEGGVRIFMTHGHRYGVKGGLYRLSLAAREKQAKLACFGHTHVPCLKQDGELTLLNPGALDKTNPTYAVADISPEGIQVTIENCY